MAEDDNRHHEPKGPGFEVWFLTLTDPVSGRGYWIRSTWGRPRTGAEGAGVCFARFDPADPSATFGIHAESATWSLDGNSFDVRIGGATMRSGLAEGALSAAGHEVAWRLSYATGAETLRLLPTALARVASTVPTAPNPAVSVSGTITVDGETEAIADAPGSQGHVDGRSHAMGWAWAHCSAFEGDEAVFQAVTARGRRRGLATPYLTFGALRWDGQWIRLSKVGRRRDFGLGMWRLDLESRRFRLTGRIEAPASAIIRARYDDPDGTERYCHNSEIASCRLALFERRVGGFEEVALLESRGTTHAEWAGLTPAPQVSTTFAEVGP